MSAWRSEAVPYLTTLGERIRKAREKLGRSQIWLADEIGMDYASLRGIEKGRSAPKVETLIRIAAALTISFDYLLAGLDPDDGAN